MNSKLASVLSSKRQSILLAVFLLFKLHLSFATQSALAVDEGFQWWQPVYAEFPLLNQRLRGYLESNSRLKDGLNGMNEYQLRTAVGYRPRQNIAFFQGYTYVNFYRADRIQEHRSYQQAGLGHVLFDRIQVLHRLRAEQRFIERTDGCANRLRYLLRMARPIKDSRWYLVTSDELFVNLNSVNGGPQAGFDQNRLYGGLGRQLNNKLRFEVGYQFQYISQPNPLAEKANHVLMTQTYISL